MNPHVCAEEDRVTLLLETAARSLDPAVSLVHDRPNLLPLSWR